MWKSVKLKDLPIEIIDGDRSHRYPKRNQLQDYGIPFLSSTNIVDNRLDLSSVNYISQNKFSQLRKGKLNPLDIVMTTRGSIGKVALFNSSRYQTGFINAQMLILRPKENRFDNKFLFYLLCGDVFQQNVQNFASGVAQPQIPIRDLREIKLRFPSIHTQRKIAAVLSAYDDLIENNTRRIEILEAMARAIYREWFVEFRFPGHEDVEMVDSGLGSIPEGWEVMHVREIVKRLRPGKRYKQKEVKERGKIPVIPQSQDKVMGFHDNEPDFKPTPKDPIIIFGDHTCKMQLMIKPFSVGSNVVPFVPNDNHSALYLYYLTRELIRTREYKRHWTPFKNKRVILAPVTLSEQFAKIIEPFQKQKEVLLAQNQVLRQTRDLLLPKLVSGEVDVSELEIKTR